MKKGEYFKLTIDVTKDEKTQMIKGATRLDMDCTDLMAAGTLAAAFSKIYKDNPHIIMGAIKLFMGEVKEA